MAVTQKSYHVTTTPVSNTGHAVPLSSSIRAGQPKWLLRLRSVSAAQLGLKEMCPLERLDLRKVEALRKLRDKQLAKQVGVCILRPPVGSKLGAGEKPAGRPAPTPAECRRRYRCKHRRGVCHESSASMLFCMGCQYHQAHFAPTIEYVCNLSLSKLVPLQKLQLEVRGLRGSCRHEKHASHFEA